VIDIHFNLSPKAEDKAEQLAHHGCAYHHDTVLAGL
jgi:hypothetical protein